MDDDTKKALAEIMASALTPVNTAIEGIRNDLSEQGQKVATLHEKIEANAATMSKVEPLAGKLENCAASMEAAGVGLEPNNGHVFHLRKMASHMRAEAAMGRMPSSYASGMGYYASADTSYQRQAVQPVVAPVAAPVAVTTPAPRFEDTPAYQQLQATLQSLSASFEATKGELKTALDRASSLETKLADVQASARRQTEPPQRQTMTPQLQRLLSKTGIDGPGDNSEVKLSNSQVSQLLASAKDVNERIRIKTQLAAQGLIDPAASY